MNSKITRTREKTAQGHVQYITKLDSPLLMLLCGKTQSWSYFCALHTSQNEKEEHLRINCSLCMHFIVVSVYCTAHNCVFLCFGPQKEAPHSRFGSV